MYAQSTNFTMRIKLVWGHKDVTMANISGYHLYKNRYDDYCWFNMNQVLGVTMKTTKNMSIRSQSFETKLPPSRYRLIIDL